MDLGSSTLAVAIQGVRALISAYDGYEKGRFMKSDEAVRAEIQRRCEMLTRHAEKLQGDVHAAGKLDARRNLETMIESVNILRNEAQFSITSNHVSQHTGIGKLENCNKDLRTSNYSWTKRKSNSKILKRNEMALRSRVSLCKKNLNRTI